VKSMSKQRRYFFALSLAWMITLIPSIYYTGMQIRENNIVKLYMQFNSLEGLPLTKETAILVSDTVRRDFNIDEKTFAKMEMTRRPFLRESVSELLTYKEGLCGEGTRVITDILNRLGFDSTRVTLYNRQLRSVHTLVSVEIQNREFLVDSINSPDNFNALVRNYDVSRDDFKVVQYSDSVEVRRKMAKALSDKTVRTELIPFSSRFWLYSYEATPYSKLLSRLGIGIRIFNLERPHRLISLLAERPNTVLAIFFFIASITCVYLLHHFNILRRILNRS